MVVKAPQKLVRKKPFWHRLSELLIGLNRDHLTQLIVSLATIALSLVILRSGIMNRIETLSLDLLFQYRPAIPVSKQIVYVEIAEDSLEVIKERPWPRHYHGVILDVLKKWGAKAVLFDYLFEGDSEPFDDDVMEESLKKNKGVYLPVFVEFLGGKKVVLHSISKFENLVSGTGHINVNPDDDGILRRFKPFIDVDGILYPHLGLKIAYDVLGKPLNQPSDIPFPLDENGSLLISWPGRWTDVFKHYSYVDILKSYERIKGGGLPTVNPTDFKGKICIIGHTAAGSTDIKATPLDKAYPGPGVIASIMNGALMKEFVIPGNFHQNAVCLVLLGFLSLIFFLPFKNLFSLLGGIVLVLGWVGFAYSMFVLHGLWLNVFQPIQLIIILFLFSALFSKIASDRERIEFYKLSTTDGLTGVAVRRYFDVMCQRSFDIAKRFRLPLSIVLIDIDHFKKVNDTYGHQGGDEVLRRTADLIRSGIRFQPGQTDGDLIARYGGEEFVLLLPKTDLKTAAFNVADRIRKAIEESPIEWEGKQISVTISLGVASMHDFDESSDSIIRRADEALYRSKEAGRNRTSIEVF